MLRVLLQLLGTRGNLHSTKPVVDANKIVKRERSVLLHLRMSYAATYMLRFRFEIALISRMRILGTYVGPAYRHGFGRQRMRNKALVLCEICISVSLKKYHLEILRIKKRSARLQIIICILLR